MFLKIKNTGNHEFSILPLSNRWSLKSPQPSEVKVVSNVIQTAGGKQNLIRHTKKKDLHRKGFEYYPIIIHLRMETSV